jgi:hypothetical protein
VKTPENARIVTINHHGNFVIFPKISFYNNRLHQIRFGNEKEKYLFDPSEKLHDKFETADQFAIFLKTVRLFAKSSDNRISVPLDLVRRYGRNVTKRLPDLNRLKKIKEICRLLENHNYRMLFQDLNTSDPRNGEFEFELQLFIDVMNLYFLNADCRLVKIKTAFSLLDILEDENDYYRDFLAITLEHLETGRFVEPFDDTAYHTIEELKKLIIISNEKYPESII